MRLKANQCDCLENFPILDQREGDIPLLAGMKKIEIIKRLVTGHASITI